jgi:hypothetical protein
MMAMQIDELEVSPGRTVPASTWMTATPKVLDLALRVLGQRTLVWVATVGGLALWTLSVRAPDPWRLLAAAGYCVTVLVPVLFYARQ